jgi:hypothetical protein
MRRLITILVISILTAFWAAFEFQAQAPPQTPAPTTPARPAFDPQKLADDWLTRLNALDHWHLSVEGKEEGVEELVNNMMELYAPDVIAEVPPHDEDQIGPVMLRGTANLRKWVEKVARTQVKLFYIQKRQTVGSFEGQKLVYTTPLPWGGVGLSFQIIAAYSLRENRRKFTAPGMVLLQVGADGIIKRLRLFLAEIAEVEPPIDTVAAVYDRRRSQSAATAGQPCQP